ncbi:MAG: hypothetical protein WCL44_11950 [bacterium]
MKHICRVVVVVAAAAVVLCLGACRRDDYRTHKISVPGLKNERCTEIIQEALVRYAQQSSMDGSIKLDTVRYNTRERWVVIQYDSMKVALKNLEHTIAAAGFAANDIPADSNAVAKLPPECKW